MNKKTIIGVIAAVVLLIGIVAIAIVSNNIGKNNNSQIIAEDDETSNSTFLAEYNGEDASWDDSIAEHITLNGSTASSDKNNVTIDNNLVKITKEGILFLFDSGLKIFNKIIDEN